MFYLFAVVLIVTAVNLARQGTEHDEEFKENAALRYVQRVLPVTLEFHGARSFVRVDGRRMVTPMLIVMFAIGSTDLLFALDSIPAIFEAARSRSRRRYRERLRAHGPAAAVLPLLGSLLTELVYLSYGLAVILEFIGVKLEARGAAREQPAVPQRRATRACAHRRDRPVAVDHRRGPRDYHCRQPGEVSPRCVRQAGRGRR